MIHLFFTTLFFISSAFTAWADVISCNVDEIRLNKNYGVVFEGDSNDFVTCDGNLISHHKDVIVVSSYLNSQQQVRFKVNIDDGKEILDCEKISIDKYNYESNVLIVNHKLLDYLNTDELFQTAQNNIIGQCLISTEIKTGHAVVNILKVRRDKSDEVIKILDTRSVIADEKGIKKGEKKDILTNLKKLIEDGQCGHTSEETQKQKLENDLMRILFQTKRKDRSLIGTLEKKYDLIKIISKQIREGDSTSDMSKLLDIGFSHEDIIKAVKLRVKPGIRVVEANESIPNPATCYIVRSSYRNDGYWVAYSSHGEAARDSNYRYYFTDLEEAKDAIKGSCETGSAFYKNLRAIGAPLGAFLKEDISLNVLRDSDFTVSDLKDQFSKEDLAKVFTPSELFSSYSIEEIKSLYTLPRILEDRIDLYDVLKVFAKEQVLKAVPQTNFNDGIDEEDKNYNRKCVITKDTYMIRGETVYRAYDKNNRDSIFPSRQAARDFLIQKGCDQRLKLLKEMNIRKADFSKAPELKLTTQDKRDIGFGFEEIKSGAYFLRELYPTFTHAEILEKNPSIYEVVDAFQMDILFKNGVTVADIIKKGADVNYILKNSPNANLAKGELVRGVGELKDTEIKKAPEMKVPCTVYQWDQAWVSTNKDGSIGGKFWYEKEARESIVQQCRPRFYNLRELRRNHDVSLDIMNVYAPLTPSEAKEMGAHLKEMDKVYLLKNFVHLYSAKELKELYSALELRKYFSLKELIRADFSKEQLKEAGFKNKDIRKTKKQLKQENK